MFLEDVVSPLMSSHSVDRAILDVLDLAAFLKDLPIRCSSSFALQERCEAMFEKYENELESYGLDRVLKPTLFVQKVLTMTKLDDVLKTKSNLISALRFHFPQFQSLFSNDENNDDDNELNKALKTALHMLIRFRGGGGKNATSFIGSDTRVFVRSVSSSLLSSSDKEEECDDD